ncbi:MAG: PBP1A family penicillin-binding protein [Vicinamibacterales bacterium]
MPPAVNRKATRTGRRTRRRGLRRWFVIAAALGAIPSIILTVVLGYYYVRVAAIIDARLHGERERVLPRIYARPLELRAGQMLSQKQLIDRLNDLGYAGRGRASSPGEFVAEGTNVTFVPRSGPAAGKMVTAVFTQKPAVVRTAAGSAGDEEGGRLERLVVPGAPEAESIVLEAPLLTALIRDSRKKRREVALDQIPDHVVKAVLAIEDRRFYDHPGVDPIRAVRAIVTNMRGEKPYLVGGSTITQQLVKNVFLASLVDNPMEKSYRRKLMEQFMALVLERRASKDEILGLYLNEVYLGQRGSFAVHGIPEGARLFFGKDVSNLSVAEGATLAGVIQSPHTWSPFAAPERSRSRRNVVLREMVESGFIDEATASAAAAEPMAVAARALEAEAPYFVDLVEETLAGRYPELLSATRPLEVYTTLDLNLQRIALDAVHDGLAHVDSLLGKRRKPDRPPQAALVAVDPRTGEVLALVGGRFYNQSHYNRATAAHRQPGSVFKPFVYLSAFEWAASEGRTDITPATVVMDEPTTFWFEDQEWTPSNYEDSYDGTVTLRHALANSRNIATIKVAEMAGYERIADLWTKIGASTAARPYPSIALGVFEATPMEVATAFTIFPSLGEVRPLKSIKRITVGGSDVPLGEEPAPRRVARKETTFLVTNMLRSVINEGTGAGARAAGFTLDAGGKTGTTNDLRDAWFAGFTPELLTVVWVGYDDNQALGLSGAQAALPIWTNFMIRALAGRDNVPFEPPEGITFLQIDRDTGKLAVPGCPRTCLEAFLAGSEPTEYCTLHRY